MADYLKEKITRKIKLGLAFTHINFTELLYTILNKMYS